MSDILLVFEVPYRPEVEGMPGKLVIHASNLVSFHGSHIDGIVCVKQIGLGSARTLKKY